MGKRIIRRRSDVDIALHPHMTATSFPRYHMDALPAELCQAILRLLPPPMAWSCRKVCRAWCAYIEHHMSKDWLLGSWLVMIHYSHPRVLCLYSGDIDLPHFDVAFCCDNRDGDFLVYTTPESFRASRLDRPRRPWLRPLQYIRYLREYYYRSTSRFAGKLRRDRIWLILIDDFDLFPERRSMCLFGRKHHEVFLGRRREGFRMADDNTLLLDWRAIFSASLSSPSS